MYLLKVFRFCIGLFIISLFISSCVVENAKIPQKQQIIIFSDCLHKKDEKLFSIFRKRNHVDVKIVFLETDSLILKLKNEGINTNADLIVLKSIVTANKIDKLNLLNSSKSDIINELIEKRFRSKNNTWFGIGIDPYMLIVKNKANKEPEKYSDLLISEYSNQWTSTLQTKDELTPFLSVFLRNKKRNKTSDYYKKYLESELYLGENNEDFFKTNYCFTLLSTYVNEIQSDDKQLNLFHSTFLNQTVNGAYYNMHCAGIVKQAKNFENAKLLLEYISTTRFNEIINNLWKTVPISLHKRIHPFEYQNIDFNIYNGYVSKQVLNYKLINKLITKNQKSKVIEYYSEPLEVNLVDTLNQEVLLDSLEN